MRLKLNCYLLFFILIWAISSCATLHKNYISTQDIPAYLQEHFSACSPLDGGVHFQLNRGPQVPVIKGELDWRSLSNSSWELQLLDPMGRSHLDIRREQSNINSSGEAASYLPTLAVKSGGMLTANGVFIGFMADEISCLLSFKLPHSWLQFITQFSGSKDESHFTFNDNYRSIDTIIKSKDLYKTTEICSLISWHGLFGLNKQSMSWCMKIDSKQFNANLVHQGTNIQVSWTTTR